MASLYNIQQDFYRLMEKIQEQGGELYPEDEQAFEQIQMDKSEKYEQYCMVIRQLKADGETYKAEKERFEEKQKSAERTADRLKERLAKAMSDAGEQKFKTPLFDLSFRNSQAVKIEDEGLIPQKYYKVEYKLDKAGIKEVLKNGGEVAGASLVTNTSLQIK